MVKLAILICGEYRSFDLGYKTFNIFDKLNPDYYFSTWDKSHEKNQDLGIDIQQDINEENITKFLPNVKISILNNQTYTEKGYTNTEKMYFHWKNALQMVLDSGEEYTHIFLTRPDIWLEKLNDIDDFEFLEKNECHYILSEYRIYYCSVNRFNMDDRLLLGCYETMKKFIIGLPLDASPIHDGLAKYLMTTEFCVEAMPIKGKIIRGNCRGVDNLNNDILNKTRIDWRNSILKTNRII